MEQRRRCKVFLDSNVLISGLFSDRGAPRIILDLLSLNLSLLKGATSLYNIMEIERNLKKKMPDVLPVYNKYLKKLNLEIVRLPSKQIIRSMSGIIAKKDAPVLASAITCGADYLITGDKKDFNKARKAKVHNLKIVSPSEFIETAFPEWIKESF